MYYRNPTFTETGAVDCEINHPHYGWIPFTASPTDSEKHGRDLHEAILADGGIAAYVAPPPPTEAELLATLATQARAKRNALLTASDWTQVADAPVDQTAWATYRKTLRDITDQEGFPETIVWPVEP